MNPPGRQPYKNAPERASHVHEDVKAYLDGELSTLRRWQVRWHLSRCAECREEVKWLDRLGEDMRDLERAQPRPELRRRILASLPETPPGRAVEMTPLRPAFGAPRFAFAGACLALFGVGAFAVPRLFSSPAKPTVAVVTPQNSPKPETQIHPSHNERRTPKPDSQGSRFAIHQATKPSYDPFSPRNLDGPEPVRPRTLNDNDAINRKADKIFAQRMQARVRQEQNAWNQLLAHSPSLRKVVPSGIKPPMRLTLSVAPHTIATSRGDIIALTQKVGGTVYTTASENSRQAVTTTAAPGVAMGNPYPLSGISAHQASRANVLLLKIPAEKADALLQSLRHMGTINSPPANTSDPAIATMTRQALKPVVSADSADPLHSAPLPEPMPKEKTKEKTNRYVFVLVQMLSTH